MAATIAQMAEIQRIRLLYDDKALVNALKVFLQWTEADQDAEKRKPLEDKVMLYLDMVEQEALMSERIVNMNGREILRYQQESKTIEQDIEKTKEEVETLKVQLEQAKILRKNKEQYDALAGLIMQHPARSETEKNLEKLNDEINKLTEQKAELDQHLELRKKQFHALLLSIHELSTQLDRSGDEGGRSAPDRRADTPLDTPSHSTDIAMEDVPSEQL